MFSYVFLFLQMFLLFISGYWIFISFFGFGKATRPPVREPQKRFLFLVPAHNEEKVIGALVENLMSLDYPRELYAVCVIADNSTDKTADIARVLGAVVLEHTSLPGEKKGKPYAIKYALDNIEKLFSEAFDAVAIFDADNLVSLNYLREMNNHLLNGDKLVQCYIDSKNPNDNFITLGYATSFFYINRSWQLARYRLGFGNSIGGTGFCVDVQVMKKVGWTARSLTEDLEFTVQCLLIGIKATWCHYARVYDEKPEKFSVSCVQRLRWVRGHWDVCFKYFGRLLLRGITHLDRCALDGVICLFNPAKTLLETISLILGVVSFFVLKQNFFMFYSTWFSFSLIIFPCMYAFIVCSIDTNKQFNRVKAVLGMLFLNFLYIPLCFWGLITYKNKTWIRTEHVKNVLITHRNAAQTTPVETSTKNFSGIIKMEKNQSSKN
jgi:cellulose synthase/poly-beta-1,6-N-acetylglucosamine synthase-like glycosyltransferase